MKSICFKASIIFLSLFLLFSLFISSTLSSEIDYFNEGFYHYNLAESAMKNKNYMMAFQEYGKAAELFEKGGYTEMKNLSIEKSTEASKMNTQSSSSQQNFKDSDPVEINSGFIIIVAIFLLLYILSQGKSGKKQGPRSVQGDNHRSNAETRISNWFARNGIKHYYESEIISKRFWEGGKSRYYLPDFYLPKFGIYVEYWGLAGEDTYDGRSLEKQQYYEKRKMKLMSLYPPDLKNIEQAFRREFRNIMGYEYPHRIKYSDLFDVPENK